MTIENVKIRVTLLSRLLLVTTIACIFAKSFLDFCPELAAVEPTSKKNEEVRFYYNHPFAFTRSDDPESRKVDQILLRRSSYKNWDADKVFSDPQTLALCEAIKKQDVDKMQELIDSGANVNAKGTNGAPLLAWAYNFGNKGLECLLKNGANPNFIIEPNWAKSVDFYWPIGGTLLLDAVDRADIEPDFEERVKILLKYGADPNLGERKPLTMGCMSSYIVPDVFSALLDAGADINVADRRSDRYPIVACILARNTGAALELLKRGAICELNTPQGNALQRVVYEATVNDPRAYETFTAQEKVELEKIKKTLEEHGFEFDRMYPAIVDGKFVEPKILKREP